MTVGWWTDPGHLGTSPALFLLYMLGNLFANYGFRVEVLLHEDCLFSAPVAHSAMSFTGTHCLPLILIFIATAIT